MARFQDDCVYHIYNIGCNKEIIFFEERNYKYLIRRMIHNYKKCGVKIIAFCLMPNHYHLLLKQETGGSISDFLKSTFTSYVLAINNQENRSGRLFESDPKYVQIEKTDYMQYLIWYIHNNPIKAGLVKRIADWKHSNYLECIGNRSSYPFDLNLINETFISQSDYKEFTKNYKNENEFELQKNEYFIDEE